METAPLNSSSPSQLAILTWLGETVKASWDANRYPLSGTHAHKLIGDHFGELDYRSFGAERFKEFLQPGTGKFFQMVVDGARHVLYPLGVDLAPASPRLKQANYLKPEIWAAFMRSGDHHFDRSSGEFRRGPATDLTRHVRVEQISDSAERAWFLDFIAERDTENLERVRQSIDATTWKWDLCGPATFLKNGIILSWKRFRFLRVLESVEAWCERNQVVTDIFAPPISKHGTSISLDQAAQSITPPSQRSSPVIKPKESRDEFRLALLSALQQMSTEELSRLPIPPCYLFHFREWH